jgi:hypothetical protein
MPTPWDKKNGRAFGCHHRVIKMSTGERNIGMVIRKTDCLAYRGVRVRRGEDTTNENTSILLFQHSISGIYCWILGLFVYPLRKSMSKGYR